MTKELYFCPICKEKQDYLDVGLFSNYLVRCGFCGAQGRLCDTEQEAVETWNKNALDELAKVRERYINFCRIVVACIRWGP